MHYKKIAQSVRLGNWTNETPVSIFGEWSEQGGESLEVQDWAEKYHIVLAYYAYEGYDGTAFMLLQDKLGQLYEVYGSHCSCNGLEGQFEPEVSELVELEKRLLSKFGYNRDGEDTWATELSKVLTWLVPLS